MCYHVIHWSISSGKYCFLFVCLFVCLFLARLGWTFPFLKYSFTIGCLIEFGMSNVYCLILFNFLQMACDSFGFLSCSLLKDFFFWIFLWSPRLLGFFNASQIESHFRWSWSILIESTIIFHCQIINRLAFLFTSHQFYNNPLQTEIKRTIW